MWFSPVRLGCSSVCRPSRWGCIGMCQTPQGAHVPGISCPVESLSFGGHGQRSRRKMVVGSIDPLASVKAKARNETPLMRRRVEQVWKLRWLARGFRLRPIRLQPVFGCWIVLIHQNTKFFISEFFKVIQEAIPLIPHCRTMC